MPSTHRVDSTSSQPLAWEHAGFFRRVLRYRLLLAALISRDLKIRYKRSILGVVWALFEPLVQMLIYTAVFSYILRVNVEAYPVFVLAGLLPWGFFRSTLALSEGAITNNRTLVKKMPFPHEILVLASSGSRLLNLLVAFMLLIPFLVYYRIAPTWSLVGLPAIVLAQSMLTLGFAMVIAAACVQYRDVGFLASFAVSALFYLSPILYPSSMVPERYLDLYYLNPMAGFMDAYRASLLGAPWPSAGMLAYAAIVSMVVFAGGYGFFRRRSLIFAELL